MSPEPTSVEADAYRYWAFISYASEDVHWARWLHRGIESYGIPAPLVGVETPRLRRVPKRLRPLFRDRDELAASADLRAGLGEALRESRYLIIICSPSAARSEWVDHEIRTFQGLGRPDRVLAVIVGGTPGSGDDQECLPSSLRTNEPIAADVRPSGDGKRDAKLKIVAGMLGVGFDTLKQRETRLRMQRLRAVVALSLVLALGFAGLAYYANQQRRAAVSARQQLEEMVGYLLNDLVGQLKPLGRLDIVKDIQAQLDDHYRRTADGGVSTPLNRSRSLAIQGEIAEAQGDVATARARTKQAVEVLAPFAAKLPDDEQVQRELVHQYYSLGLVRGAEGHVDGERALYRKGIAIAERFAADDRRDPLWHIAVGKGRLLLAYSFDDGPAREREFQQAIGAFQMVCAIDPTTSTGALGLAKAYSGRGWAITMNGGDRADQLKAYEDAQRIIAEQQELHPSDIRWREEDAALHHVFAEHYFGTGDVAAGMRHVRKDADIRTKLIAEDPENPRRQYDLAAVHTWAGFLSSNELFYPQGYDLRRARQEYELAVSTLSALVKQHPDSETWSAELKDAEDRIQWIDDRLTGREPETLEFDIK